MMEGFEVKMFKEYDIVRINKNFPKYGLLAGAKGTILLIYLQPPLSPAYEVEFTDGKGNAIAIFAVEENDIEKVES